MTPEQRESLMITGKLLAMSRADEYNSYKKDIRDALLEAFKAGEASYKNEILERAQVTMAQDRDKFPASILIIEFYRAFGWQGGTIHQIMAEIKRLQEIEKAGKYTSEKLALEAENKRLREALELLTYHVNGVSQSGGHPTAEELCFSNKNAQEALSVPPPPVSGILRLAKAADEYMQAKNMMYGADCDDDSTNVSYIVCRKHAQLQLAHQALTPDERAMLGGVEC